MSNNDAEWLAALNEFLVDKAALHQKKYEKHIDDNPDKYASLSELKELNRVKEDLLLD